MAVKWFRYSHNRWPAPPSPEESTASISPFLRRGNASAKEIWAGMAPAARKVAVPLASGVRIRRPRSASMLVTGFRAQRPAGGHALVLRPRHVGQETRLLRGDGEKGQRREEEDRMYVAQRADVHVAERG